MALPAWPRPRDILDYYERMTEALRVLRVHLTARPSPVVSGPFFGMTEEEIERTLSRLRDELDAEVVMSLSAGFEAVLRTDFEERVDRRLKDRVSRAFRELARKHGERQRLEDILDVWKTHSGQAALLGRLSQLLQFRHWLAHGRYWVQKSGVNPDPYDAWETAREVAARIPDLARLTQAS